MAVNFRNVTGVSTNAGTSALKNAGSLFNNAFENLSGITKENNQKEIDNNTNIALSKLQRLASTDELNNSAVNFTNNSLTEAFGKGKFDLGKITTALTDKRKSIKDTNRSDILNARNDLTFSQNQQDRTERKNKEKIALEVDPLKAQADLALAEDAQILESTLSNIKTDKVLSPEEETNAVQDLRDFIQQVSPDASFGSSITGDLGGAELQDEVSKYLREGIITSSGKSFKVDPRVLQRSIQQVLQDAGNQGFLDPSVDEDELRKQILLNINQNDINKARSNIANQQSQSNRRDITNALQKLTDTVRNKFSGK